ncbi:MAG: Ig-like domain-containing protein, partial [Nitrososphaeraceae archaeon]
DEDTGSVVYNPNNGYTGSDSFTFTASDGSSTSNTAKVSITVNPVTNINATSAPENANANANQSAVSNINATSAPENANENQSAVSNATSLPSNETD